MKLSDLLKFEEDLSLEKKTVVILRWIALIGQLITIYFVHFYINFELPLIFCSLTIFFGGLTNIFIQFNFKKNQLSNIESTILLFYDVIQLAVLIYLTGGVTNPFIIFLNYFGFRFGYEARRRGNALNRLELVLAKEQELESIGHQAAAAAHSLGTPLSCLLYTSPSPRDRG